MIINAYPLIIFGRLNRIDILKNLYREIKVSNEVYNKVVLKGIEKNSMDAFIVKEQIENNIIRIISLNEKFSSLSNKIKEIYNIDIGEAETISLALQLGEKEAIIDEISAREAAKAFGIKPIGSLRVLLIAYKNKSISKSEIKDLVNEMENTKYRLSPKVLIEFWRLLENIR